MKHFLLCFFCILSLSVTSQKGLKTDYTFQSSVFDDNRTISVYLPPVYFESETDTFNIIYILDGHYPPFIDMCAKIIEYGVHNYKFTNNIVVAIHQKNRGWEFSDPIDDHPDEEISYDKGRAPELFNHIKDEVMPYVKNLNLRTREFNTIIGHSSGAHFVLNTLFSANNHIFDAYIAISPSIYPQETNLIDRVDEYTKKGFPASKYLYISSGTVGEREELFSKGVCSIDSILSESKHSLIWTKGSIQGTDHFTCVSPSINESLMDLTSLLRIGEAEYTRVALDSTISLKDHIKNRHIDLSQKFNYYDVPPAPYLRSVAFYLQQKGMKQSALDIYDFAASNYESNFKIMRSRAKVLKDLGRMKEAHESFIKAKDLLLLQKKSMDPGSYEWYVKKIDKALFETKP